MQHLEVSCAVRPIWWLLGVRWLVLHHTYIASLVISSLYPCFNLGLLNWKFRSFVCLEHNVIGI